MKVKMILPALTEAKSPFWRPIKYSLFPPLGLATLASYLSEDDKITLQDEHVETLDLSDEPDLVVIATCTRAVSSGVAVRSGHHILSPATAVSPAAAPHSRSSREGEAEGSTGRSSATRSMPVNWEITTTGMAPALRLVNPPVKSAAP